METLLSFLSGYYITKITSIIILKEHELIDTL